MPTMDFFWLSWLSRSSLVLRAPKSELKRLRYYIPKIANERYTVQALSKLAGWFLCEGYTVQEIDFWCLWYTWAYQKLFSFHIAFAAGASAWVSSESKNIFRQHAASIYGFVRTYVRVCVEKKSHFQGDTARRREASYDVARLLLMAPIDPWRNSTPDFGAVAFCTTNIEDFRTSLTSTSSTISSTYSSQKRS